MVNGITYASLGAAMRALGERPTRTWFDNVRAELRATGKATRTVIYNWKERRYDFSVPTRRQRKC